MTSLVKLGEYDITTESLGNLIKLADSLEVVKTKEDGSIYLKFKADVILEIEKNFATIVDGFNVQVATQIHLNPDIEKTEFKDLVIQNFYETNRKLVAMAGDLMNLDMTEEEITEVVEGIVPMRHSAEGTKYIQQYNSNDPGCCGKIECRDDK